MIRNRIDRWFDRFRRTGDARLLARVFDATAPELWRVAAHLCRDRHAAEDAVQATFLSAIEGQRDWDASRPLLPWLCGMLANRVREQRRRDARTPAADRLAVVAERDPADVAADREVSATLRCALRQVDEPYRTTLERHLVHGFTAVEIAAELAVPAGTVRMRLHRGLDRLRELLPRGLVASGVAAVPLRPAVLATMRANVLGTVPGGAAIVGSGHAGSFVIGVLLMSKVFWTVLGSGLALLLVWWGWPPPAAATVVDGAPAVVAASAAERDAERGSAAAAGAASAVAAAGDRVEAAVAPTDTGSGLLRVHVRNAGNGAPVANVWLVVQGGLDRAAVAPSGAVAPRADTATAAAQRPLRAPTEADGASPPFVLPVGFATIRIDELDVRASAEVRRDEVTELQLDLPVRFTAAIRVVDDADRPVAGARLVGSTGLVAFGLAADEFGSTDADGWCRLPAIDDVLRVRAHADGFAASPSVVLNPDDATAVLRLGSGPATVDGLVADAAGAPLAGCAVALQPLPRWSDDAAPKRGAATPRRHVDAAPILVFSDAAGRFTCRDVPPGHCLVAAVRRLDDGSSRLVEQRVEVTAGGHAFVSLAFGGGATLDVGLRTADGAPVAAADVMLSLQHPDLGEFARVATVAVTTGADGEASVRDLLPGSWRAQVLHEGLVERDLVLAAGAHERFEHVFGAGPVLGVRVVDGAGRPLAGWLVTVVTGATGRREATDADGWVRFRDLPGEAGTLQVAPDEATAPLATRDVQIGTEVTVAVDPAQLGDGVVRGVLAAPAGDSLAELQVLLVRGNGTEPGLPLTLPVDPASGTFAATRLAAGSYTLVVQHRRNQAPLAVRAGLTVVRGGTLDLGTIALGTGRLVVVATMADGAAVAAPFVGIGLAGARQFGPAAGGDDGGAVALPEGNYEVLVWGEAIRPATTSAAVRQGATTEVPVAVERAAPVALSGEAAGTDALVGLLTVRSAGGSEFVVVVELPAGAALTRGFGAGQHTLELRSLAGERFAATCTVGSDLAPQQVVLRRVP
ncbi:MAG: sigma-70 family RNA polymerase sigma factor [Planctomycetes bacterium]|nr:sigma-70 family RNA polymerase sigma factor [Planctomycetota bacterium]